MSNKVKGKKKKSQAPVAFVYFATMLAFLAVFAVFAVMIINKIDSWKNPVVEETVVHTPAYNTMYARVNSKGVLSDLCVIRIASEKEQIVVTPLSAFTVSTTDNTSTFREVYETGGIKSLQQAVKSTLGIELEFYVSLNNQSFERIADIFGGIVYTPDEDLYYLSQENDSNDISFQAGKSATMGGKQIRLICQYPVFSQGKSGNVQFLGDAMSQLVNNAFQQVSITKNNLNNVYEIATSNSDTNLTKNVFKQHKAYLEEMLSKSLEPAVELVPEGTWSDDKHFVVSEEFKATLSATYEATEPYTADSVVDSESEDDGDESKK